MVKLSLDSDLGEQKGSSSGNTATLLVQLIFVPPTWPQTMGDIWFLLEYYHKYFFHHFHYLNLHNKHSPLHGWPNNIVQPLLPFTNHLDHNLESPV